MKTARARTDAVYAALRADLFAGRYAPGERLKFAELCEAYGASVSVVREALTRLTEQELVEAEPRIGFRVVPLTPEILEDLTATRIDVECLALTRAIERGGVDWEAEIVSTRHRLERTPMLTTDEPVRISDEWEDEHRRFHAALVEGCGSPRLLGIATSLRDASEFYRRLSAPSEPGRDVAAEHAAIAEATLERDVEAATAALAGHIRHTSDILAGRLAATS